LATIMDAEVRVTNNSQTSGTVIDRHIKMEAPVKRVTIPNSQTDSGPEAIWTHPEQVLEEREQIYLTGKFCKTPNRWLRLDTKEMDQCAALDIVLVMVASWWDALKLSFEDKQYDNNLHVAGIILQVNSEKLDTYRQIGVFEDCFDESLTFWSRDWNRELVEII
jgi:hypothetical protein